jgi:hypothetical protein
VEDGPAYRNRLGHPRFVPALAERSEDVICENQLRVGGVEIGDDELQTALGLANCFGDGARLTAEVDVVDSLALRDASRGEARFREGVSVCVNLRAVCH